VAEQLENAEDNDNNQDAAYQSESDFLQPLLILSVVSFSEEGAVRADAACVQHVLN